MGYESDLAQRIMTEAFADELQKIAADVRTMLNQISNAKGVHIGKSQITEMMGGAASSLPERGTKIVFDRNAAKPKAAAERLRRLGGALESAGTSLSNKGKLPALLGKPMARAGKTTRESGGVVLGGMKLARRNSLSMAGQIHVDPDATDATLRSIAGGPKLGPDAKKAQTAVVLGHEEAERRVKPGEIAPLYSHASPKVLLEEHGMLSKATGPGAAEARTRFRQLRERTGEAQHMKNLAVTALNDPRALQYFEEGQKIPKAMRKAIMRKVNEDPGLVNRTKPGRAYDARQALRKGTSLPGRVKKAVRSLLPGGEPASKFGG